MEKTLTYLPKGWELTTLEEVAIIVTGNTPPTSNVAYFNGDVPFFKPSDLNVGHVNDSKEKLSILGKELSRTLPKGSTLVTCIGSTIGKAGIISKEGAFNQQINGVFPIISNPLFFYYQIISPNFQRLIKNNSSATTVPILNRTKFGKLPFLLAPLNEQDRIVSRIEELLSGLAKSKEQLELSLRQIQFYKQSILKEIFEKDNFPKRKLGDLLLFIGSGSTPKGGKQVYSDAGIMFLRSQNIYQNKLELSNVAYITTEIHENMKRSQVKPFDVLLNITGASIGRCTYFPDIYKEANVNQHVCILRPDSDKVFYKYLSIYLNSSEAQNTIMRVQTGATRQGLNYSQIKDIDVPLPTPSVQKEIVRDIEEKNTICEKVQESIKDGLQQIETFKQTILQEAFQGLLIEQNVDDEAVLILLDNIKAKKNDYEFTVKEKRNIKIIPMADNSKSIIDILKDNAYPLSTKEVWLSSDKKDDIDGFYAELKKYIESGDIVELSRNGKESYLKLADKS